MASLVVYSVNDIIHLNTSKSCVHRHGLSYGCVKCGMLTGVVKEYRHAGEHENARHYDLFGIRDDGKEDMLTVDHILPVSWGGGNQRANLQPMCQRCNSRKSNHLNYDEARGIIANLKEHISVGEGKLFKFLPKLMHYHGKHITIDDLNTIREQMYSINSMMQNDIDYHIDKFVGRIESNRYHNCV